MKIGIISDSHGDIANIERAALLLNSADLILHLGDHASDAREMKKYTDVPVIAVRGNCDGYGSEPAEIVTSFGGARMLICHGHLLGVKYGLDRLYFRAREANASIALYGHTHHAQADTESGVLLLNPGALMNGRYAMLTIEDGTPSPRLLRL